MTDKIEATVQVEAAEREKLMNTIENYAHHYALVGEGTKRKMRAELETALRAALTKQPTE